MLKLDTAWKKARNSLRRIFCKTGNTDHVEWQVCQRGDVSIPIDLSIVTDVTLTLKNITNKKIAEFKTTDAPQKFFITNAISGKAELKMAREELVCTTGNSMVAEIIIATPVGAHIALSLLDRKW